MALFTISLVKPPDDKGTMTRTELVELVTVTAGEQMEVLTMSRLSIVQKRGVTVGRQNPMGSHSSSAL
jgi:hypothetical protein